MLNTDQFISGDERIEEPDVSPEAEADAYSDAAYPDRPASRVGRVLLFGILFICLLGAAIYCGRVVSANREYADKIQRQLSANELQAKYYEVVSVDTENQKVSGIIQNGDRIIVSYALPHSAPFFEAHVPETGADELLLLDADGSYVTLESTFTVVTRMLSVYVVAGALCAFLAAAMALYAGFMLARTFLPRVKARKETAVTAET